MLLFLRNLAKCGKPIEIEERDQDIINGQATEVFSNPITQQAIIKTLKGLAVFDDTNTERVATHEICIPMPRTLTIQSLTAVGIIITATTATPHGLKSGYIGAIAGATQEQYNVQDVTITVLNATQFTYQVIAAPTITPATGSPIFTYLQRYTSENWIKLNNRRIKILNVQNCCEKNEVLKMMCTERGEDSRVVNQG